MMKPVPGDIFQGPQQSNKYGVLENEWMMMVIGLDKLAVALYKLPQLPAVDKKKDLQTKTRGPCCSQGEGIELF